MTVMDQGNAHDLIQSCVPGAFVNHGWWSMTEQALISPVSGFEPKPDVAVTTTEQAAQSPSPFPADRVESVVEVVSSDKDADYLKKRQWYAKRGIPIYLLIDPDVGACECFSEPGEGRYGVGRTSEFGKPVPLPAPFFFDLGAPRFKLSPPR